MSQAPCGNLRELQKLLNDELPPEQAAAIVAHVQSCKPCQHLLERLVTRPIGSPPATAKRRRCDDGPECQAGCDRARWPGRIGADVGNRDGMPFLRRNDRPFTG